MRPVDDERAPRQVADAIAPPTRLPLGNDHRPRPPFGREGNTLGDSARNRIPVRPGPSARGPESGGPVDPVRRADPGPRGDVPRGDVPRGQDSGRHPQPPGVPEASRNDGAPPFRPARPRRPAATDDDGPPPLRPARPRRPGPADDDDGPPTVVHGSAVTDDRPRRRPADGPTAVPHGKSGRPVPPRRTAAGVPPVPAGETPTPDADRARQNGSGRVRQSPPAPETDRGRQTGSDRARQSPHTGSGRVPSTPEADRVRQSPHTGAGRVPSTPEADRVRQSAPTGSGRVPEADRVRQSPPTGSGRVPEAGRVRQSPPTGSGRVPQSPPRTARSASDAGRRPSRPTAVASSEAGAPPTPRRSVSRHGRGPTVTRHGPRSLGKALLATLASAVVPGTGLFMIRRKRAGTLVLGVFLLIVVALLIIGFTVRRAALVQNLLSSRVLLVVMVGLVVAGLAWITQIVRTYALASPRGLGTGSRVVGVLVVAALCLAAAAPFGYAANLVNSQRALLNNLFAGGGGTAVADAINKPRLNVLLVGSDAGPDRTGARTDTMMMASIDTTTARTTLFALPRNIGYAQFPPGSPMAEQFPKGFHDPADPLSGNYLLNAVYAWGLDHPQVAPTTPTDNPGLNLLHQSVAYMMGIDIDYYVEVNMAGFASIIDALGGVTVDVGPVPLPIGGVLPDGRHVKPSGYVPAGVQHLDGNDALWFARSRRDSDDYNRMGRQRCLLQSVLQQKSPTDVITHFNDIAAATKNSVTTNIPQEVLGQLVSLASEKPPSLQSISFDPNLPDPNQTDGHFNTSHVDVSYMREVVQNAFAAPAPVPAPTTTAAAPTTSSRGAATSPTPAPSAAPTTLACG